MIKKLEREDKEIYLQMVQEMYASDAVLHPIPLSYQEKTFEELMRSDQYAEAYLIELDHQTAGYVLTAKTFSQEAGGIVVWIEEIYIRPNFRSRGLGKEFFKWFQKNSEGSVARLRLETERENMKARNLYQNLGFKELEYYQMVKEMGDEA